MNGSYLWSWHWAQAERRSHPDLHRGIDPIDDRRDPELLVVDAALGVDHRVAMEARGDALVDSRVGEQVAGNLLDRELIERQVAVEGVDDPVAIRPDRATTVFLVAVGVGIARLVEPRPRLALTDNGAMRAAGPPAFS